MMIYMWSCTLATEDLACGVQLSLFQLLPSLTLVTWSANNITLRTARAVMCDQLQHIEADINVDRALSLSTIKAISLAKTAW